MKDLELSCRMAPSDKLQASVTNTESPTFFANDGNPVAGPLVVMTGSSVTGEKWNIILDKGTARELFNWLGVFLHAA